MSTPRRRSSRSCNKHFRRTPQLCHTFMHSRLLHKPHNHRSINNTNHSAPPFQNGMGRHRQPLYSSHKLQRTKPNPSTTASTSGRKQHKQARISASRSATTCSHRSLDRYPQFSLMTPDSRQMGFPCFPNYSLTLTPLPEKPPYFNFRSHSPRDVACPRDIPTNARDHDG